MQGLRSDRNSEVAYVLVTASENLGLITAEEKYTPVVTIKPHINHSHARSANLPRATLPVKDPFTRPSRVLAKAPINKYKDAPAAGDLNTSNE